ncbi:Peptidase C26 [Acididesulfobacillus acetoxydans]|uniref:Peptidase C26 n=1 Tax=Acididesulfobacillus acetoxydans TaxID=1561005 RepID=A0A8S0W2I0_9FIRM|nr:gamma-glutamyl-gamma-aminobutyrate hydrolase family protein [Acididesulfobacillus acetoxydans]CAA7600698.1 Peptidase C26 [Acididesulfobacillus acetoxydans]CEJ09479.1 Peptidase C26 [Acididesulfobacillus acetoxydans]
MVRPFIGITVAHHAEELENFPRHNYVQSIRKAGGVPILIPPPADRQESEILLAKLDGLVLSGGGDISPLYLGESPRAGIRNCFPERDLGEILLARSAMEKNIPLLGICRGIQVMAVAAGGSIYQDIPSQCPAALEHSQTAPRDCPWHEVEILDSGLLRIVGLKKLQVNSFHHQAVSVLPSAFRTAALAPDGIIEGIEAPQLKFCLGVQWHPEGMPSAEHSQAIFAALIRVCGNSSAPTA